MNLITELKPNEVFVFGSNAKGFHGGGAAGYGFSNTMLHNPKSDWRSNAMKQRAIKELKEGRKLQGMWNVWGVPRGHQVGTHGQSYAICTIVSPGGVKIPIDDIERQFCEMLNFAHGHPRLTLLLTEVGAGLAGHNPKQLRQALDHAVFAMRRPPNVKYLDEVYG